MLVIKSTAFLDLPLLANHCLRTIKDDMKSTGSITLFVNAAVGMTVAM